VRVSEEFRLISTAGFKRTGNIEADALNFSKYCGREADTLAKVELRLALGDPFVVHQLTESVCKKVLSVKIDNVPDTYPQFLRTPFLIESKLGKYLFDDIHAIGGYIASNNIFMLIAYCEGNALLLKNENPFDGAKIETINYSTTQELAQSQEPKAVKVLPFVTILALMLEAERTPITVDSGSKKSKKRNSKKNKNVSDWIERRIYIDARYESKQEGSLEPMNLDGKIKRNVFVQGFLRHQAYGSGHKKRKWIYIEGFESSRWANEYSKKVGKKIMVDIKDVAN